MAIKVDYKSFLQLFGAGRDEEISSDLKITEEGVFVLETRNGNASPAWAFPVNIETISEIAKDFGISERLTTDRLINFFKKEVAFQAIATQSEQQEGLWPIVEKLDDLRNVLVDALNSESTSAVRDNGRLATLHEVVSAFNEALSDVEVKRALNLEKPLDTRERTSMLRIIRALDVLAKLPERGPASSIQRQLELLKFQGPKEGTIRPIIEAARGLDPDIN